MKIIILHTLLFLSLNVISQIPLFNPFKEYKEPNSKVLSYTYQKMLEKVNDTLFVEKTFHVDTKQLTSLRTYKSIKTGVLNGYFCEKWDDGEIFIEGSFKDDVKVGKWKEYQKEGTYVIGKKSGEWKNYFDNGKLISIENYLDGKLNGEKKTLDSEGKILRSAIYENGVFIKGDTLTEKIGDEMPYILECVNVPDNDTKNQCSSEKLLIFLRKNLKYPKSSRIKEIQGQVILHFVIAKDGSIKDYKVRRSLANDIKAEVESFYNIFPKWHPGMQNGSPVDVQYSLPIKFKLK
jgi:TonB family protein